MKKLIMAIAALSTMSAFASGTNSKAYDCPVYDNDVNVSDGHGGWKKGQVLVTDLFFMVNADGSIINFSDSHNQVLNGIVDIATGEIAKAIKKTFTFENHTLYAISYVLNGYHYTEHAWIANDRSSISLVDESDSSDYHLVGNAACSTAANADR